jgi:hypothetical protein
MIIWSLPASFRSTIGIARPPTRTISSSAFSALTSTANSRLSLVWMILWEVVTQAG